MRVYFRALRKYLRMKEAMVQMARYNLWANTQMLAALSSLPVATLDSELPSSFPTLRQTVAHVRAAEQIWLERLQLAERPLWLGDDVTADFQTLSGQWRATSEGLLQFTEKQYNDKAFLHVVEYRNRAGAMYKTPTLAILQHAFNHSTYHRGQLVTMMRALGVTKIPATDFIQFVWSGGK
jgi:uncharacterized damage-inducible protein DinB